MVCSSNSAHSYSLVPHLITLAWVMSFNLFWILSFFTYSYPISLSLKMEVLSEKTKSSTTVSLSRSLLFHSALGLRARRSFLSLLTYFFSPLILSSLALIFYMFYIESSLFFIIVWSSLFLGPISWNMRL